MSLIHAIMRITANQAALWAMLHVMKVDEKVRDLGRLLEQMPAI
jgi:maleate cis-trans isomerase